MIISEKIKKEDLEKYSRTFSIPNMVENSYITIENSTPRGIIGLELKSWESGIFDQKIASINYIIVRSSSYEKDKEVYTKLLETIDLWCKENKVKLISIKINPNNIPLKHTLPKFGFNSIEEYITLSHNLEDIKKNSQNIKPFKKEDILILKKIAADSLVTSRFHMDPLIDKQVAINSRAEWIKNSCEGRADQVLVVQYNNKVVGFVACKINGNDGILDLIAVDKNYRGKDLGEDLTNACLTFFKNKNLNQAY